MIQKPIEWETSLVEIVGTLKTILNTVLGDCDEGFGENWKLAMKALEIHVTGIVDSVEPVFIPEISDQHGPHGGHPNCAPHGPHGGHPNNDPHAPHGGHSHSHDDNMSNFHEDHKEPQKPDEEAITTNKPEAPSGVTTPAAPSTDASFTTETLVHIQTSSLQLKTSYESAQDSADSW